MSDFLDDLTNNFNTQNQKKGLKPVDLLNLPPRLSKVAKKIIRRREMSLVEVAEEMHYTPEEVQIILDRLVKKGYIQQTEYEGKVWYKANFQWKQNRKPTSEVSAALESLFEQEKD